MNEDEERDLRRALEISQWEDQRRRHEEEQRKEDELQRQANLIRDEEERRRLGEGRLSVMRGCHHEEDGGNLNQEVLNELRDMRALINNSRRGGRVQLAETIEEADKSPFTYEIMHTDIPEKCVLPTLASVFSGSERDILDDVYKQQLVETRDRDIVQLEEKANRMLAGVGHEMENSVQRIFIIRNSITMNDLREYQEEYIALEEKQRQVSEMTLAPAKEGNSRLLPRKVHAVEDELGRGKGEPAVPVPTKLVAVSSGDQEWIDQQRTMGYKDSDLVPSTYNIYGFNGVASKPKGELTVKILAGELETKAIWFPMPSGIGEIRGDLRDAKECITKDVHNYEEKLRKNMEQRKKVSEERRAEQLMVFTIESSKELSGTQEDGEETNEAKIHIEEDNNAIPEEGGQVNQEKGGKAKKGKVAEGNEMTKNKKETPTTKENKIPREAGRMNRSRGKKAQGQEAEESVEIPNSQNKLKESREDEEVARLKEELYQKRRRKEDLVRERIRLERENEKLIIRNNHLKRKQADSNMQEERCAMGEERTKEIHYTRKREGLGRGEKKEREDLKKPIESSRIEFREREY
ncbi:uncharacterized protein LOC113311698 [Papaver somniferum]|uniref:uncharacterized protein LOC113311698 n=1 Tax=Papaver somniferum TaxID=3469 RepID=UPI000E6F9DB1|nr:uncharacterized protein LOC113311698 [Papaver somniferum]